MKNKKHHNLGKTIQTLILWCKKKEPTFEIKLHNFKSYNEFREFYSQSIIE